jgi:hypothetical protein
LPKQPWLAADRTPSSNGTTQQCSGGDSHLAIVLPFDCRHLTRSDTLKFVSDRAAIEELSELFVFLADNDFAGYSPVYEQLARSIAGDSQLLDFVDSSAHPNARRGRVPVLFFAATHDQVLANPESKIAAVYRGDSGDDPMPPFLELVDQQRDEIISNMRTRSVQTNEVGRSAVLALAFGRTLQDISTPASLFEIGPSAGLNLYVDHFRIDYSRKDSALVSIGPESSSVRLHCEIRGPNTPPLPTKSFDFASRSGLDPNPINVLSDSECRWLQECIWPGIPERPQRLAAALDVARQSPPRLVAGDAVTDLAESLDALPTSDHLIIFSTWALAYINADGRQAVLDAVDRLGAARDLDVITFEEPRFTPWVQPAAADVFDLYLGEGTPTQLSLRSWRSGVCTTTALAIAHPHGRWIHWLEENHG